jgi:hypothetical protein
VKTVSILEEVLKKNSSLKIVIFGAASFGKKLYRYLQSCNITWKTNIEVVAFFDNDPDKEGASLFGLPVMKPDMTVVNQTDKVLIASSWQSEIYAQLNEMGIPKEMIVSIQYFDIYTFDSFPQVIDERAVIVHSMGKVGSSTVFESINHANINFIAYHTHSLTESALNAQYNALKQKGLPLGLHLYHGKMISKFKNEVKDFKWKVITLVREPISRNISAFFQNIEKHVPNLKRKCVSQININELIQIFLGLNNNIPLKWIDSEIKGVFGIDLFLRRTFPMKPDIRFKTVIISGYWSYEWKI